MIIVESIYKVKDHRTFKFLNAEPAIRFKRIGPRIKGNYKEKRNGKENVLLSMSGNGERYRVHHGGSLWKKRRDRSYAGPSGVCNKGSFGGDDRS